jgi:hypothetical protein
MSPLKKACFLLLFIVAPSVYFAQVKTIHVFVALCDNEHQGIVRVPKAIGDGKNPSTNLYWGAGYGVKHFFDKKSPDWVLIKTIKQPDSVILERILFKHVSKEIYLLADAYDGEQIKTCIKDFLRASNGQTSIPIAIDSTTLYFGGKANLISYVGHDGLMEFTIDIDYTTNKIQTPKDVIILACFSKEYFAPHIKKAQANPILWTTHLMAPEAYTLKAAIDGWIRKESGTQIDERAAQTYNQYQKCGITGARNLFTTGF